MEIPHPVDDGHVPNINRPGTVLGVTITFLVLACIAVILRLYVRLRDRLWGYDDFFVFVAGFGTATGSILTCLMPTKGMGKHYWTLPEAEVTEYFKHVWATNTTYAASTTLIKLSILFQYLRLFNMQNRFARILTWALIALVACWGTAFFLLALFSCTPIQKNWNFDVEGTCVAWGSKNPNIFFATFAAHSASNMMLDFVVLLLPVPFLGELRMGSKTRRGLVALFTLGGIVAILSVVRLIVLCLKRAGTVPYFDPTFAAPGIYIFSVLEVDIAIICASIPTFWPLVTSFAANKILVVNEIEIRTDRRSSNIGLAEHGSSFVGDDRGRSSRLSTLIHSTDAKPARANSRLGRSSSHSTSYRHTHNPSSTSSMKKNPGMNIAIELGHRVSQESQRNLAHQDSAATLSYDSSPDLAHPLDPPRNGSQYNDRYVQHWALPDFGSATDARPSQGMETRVEKAELPYEHMRAREK